MITIGRAQKTKLQPRVLVGYVSQSAYSHNSADSECRLSRIALATVIFDTTGNTVYFSEVALTSTSCSVELEPVVVDALLFAILKRKRQFWLFSLSQRV